MNINQILVIEVMECFIQRQPRQVTLQHDNVRPHTTRVTQQFSQRNHIYNVLLWPANGQDLNPIEHIWDEYVGECTRNLFDETFFYTFHKIIIFIWAVLSFLAQYVYLMMNFDSKFHHKTTEILQDFRLSLRFSDYYIIF